MQQKILPNTGINWGLSLNQNPKKILNENLEYVVTNFLTKTKIQVLKKSRIKTYFI